MYRVDDDKRVVFTTSLFSWVLLTEKTGQISPVAIDVCNPLINVFKSTKNNKMSLYVLFDNVYEKKALLYFKLIVLYGFLRLWSVFQLILMKYEIRG